MCYINKKPLPQQMHYNKEKDDCNIIYCKLNRSLFSLSSMMRSFITFKSFLLLHIIVESSPTNLPILISSIAAALFEIILLSVRINGSNSPNIADHSVVTCATLQRISEIHHFSYRPNPLSFFITYFIFDKIPTPNFYMSKSIFSKI